MSYSVFEMNEDTGRVNLDIVIHTKLIVRFQY